MSSLWGRVDDYIEDKLVQEDAALGAVLAANTAAGLRPIDVSAAQGKLLHLLVRMSGARRVLEIGTLGANSTIWMAKALPPDGQVVTLEYEPHHAAVALQNIQRSGLADRIEVRVGAAADTLPVLAAELAEAFDFIFIDADKPSNTTYLEWAVRLGRPGTVIVLDNVVRDGELIDANSTDRNVRGSRDALDFIASHPRLSATALQTVGGKGYDGFALMILD